VDQQLDQQLLINIPRISGAMRWGRVIKNSRTDSEAGRPFLSETETDGKEMRCDEKRINNQPRRL